MAKHGRYMYGKGCRCDYCVEAQNTYVRRWMAAKGAAIRARAYAKRRAIIDELKSKPCADCQETYPPYCMDFDHLGDKEFNIGSGNKISITALMAEIEKCEVVCANCHRMRTHERGQYTATTYLEDMLLSS